MSSIDHRIPLMVRQPDIVNALARGTEAAGLANAVGRENALHNALAEHGQGIAAGDQTAMNALAAVDPRVAFGMNQQRAQGQRADAQLAMSRERLDMAREQAIRALTEAEDQKAAEQEATRATEFGQRLVAAYGNDPRAWAMGTRELVGVALPMTDEGLAQLSVVSDAAQTYLANRPKVAEVPASVQALQMRAEAAGMQPGTPEYQSFMASGGRGQETVFGPDGMPIYQSGGYAVPPEAAPAPEAETTLPPSGGDEAFGVEGVAKGAVNTDSDFLGLGEVFENAAEQSRFFKNMEEDLLVSLAQGYGRQPAQALMERLRSLVPNAGTIEGANRAFGEVEAMERRFTRDLRVLEQQVHGRMSQSDRVDIRAKMFGIQSALATIDEAKQRLRPQSEETTGGVQWRILE